MSAPLPREGTRVCLRADRGVGSDNAALPEGLLGCVHEVLPDQIISVNPDGNFSALEEWNGLIELNVEETEWGDEPCTLAELFWRVFAPLCVDCDSVIEGHVIPWDDGLLCASCDRQSWPAHPDCPTDEAAWRAVGWETKQTGGNCTALVHTLDADTVLYATETAAGTAPDPRSPGVTLALLTTAQRHDEPALELRMPLWRFLQRPANAWMHQLLAAVL